jgi:hypothetical protein
MAEKRLKIAYIYQNALKPTREQHDTIRYQEEWLFFSAGNIYPSSINTSTYQPFQMLQSR